MDIHQLRSWIFELYEPLEDERQYIVFDRARGNLLIDAPAFSDRALRLIRGAGESSVLVITNAARGGDAARYGDALGVQIAAHADDASFVPGGADLVRKGDDLLRPDAQVIRVGEDGDAATVVLGRKAGGVLFCGDLDLGSDAARELTKLQFSAVLSARRPPLWKAGRDTLLFLQRELPPPRKRVGVLAQAPGEPADKGRRGGPVGAQPAVGPAGGDAPARRSPACLRSDPSGAGSISRPMAARSRSRGIAPVAPRSTPCRSPAIASSSSPKRARGASRRAGRPTGRRSRSCAIGPARSGSASGSSIGTASTSASSRRTTTSRIGTSRGRPMASGSRAWRMPVGSGSASSSSTPESVSAASSSTARSVRAARSPTARSRTPGRSSRPTAAA